MSMVRRNYVIAASIWLILILAVFLIAFAMAINIIVSKKQSKEIIVNGDKAVVSIGNTQLVVRIADTPAKQNKGLGGQTNLGANEGILFVFTKSDYYSFWMKDMLFPIDIIWIGENGQVMGVTEHVKPDSFPRTYQPPTAARYVLEVQDGWAQRYKIKVGDLVTIKEN
ncbi:hypothetical protein A3E96_01885 [Candidatus Uhrbacteria bacterium RIFCSPHIGHO2_12_FULL_46_13]|nr:MAG: hypothetical protein UX68_C0032G0019 [Parcubacteria group bacterium GW2011_GWA2_46_9]OGL75106.1 MAG: hypothetical protein A3E96_01885 [Candidatus Uhrbacteria bacterium RIFCSPHIGHO2_12_FULL_46_13]